MSERNKDIFIELLSLVTEQRNPRTMDIDERDTLGTLRVINAEDKLVADAVEKEIPRIEKAVKLIVTGLRRGGRLFYFGAGTSGRVGVFDAAECPPTYGTPPEMVQGIIAGGRRALYRAVEGAEDRGDEARKLVRKLRVGRNDVVIGIAASRRTPFAKAAVAEARRRGARTVYLTCNPRRTMDFPVDVAICPEVGPEVIMGSTRMKAGTAQKLVLNMLSTCAMIQLGKVFENMMVDLMATSKKLAERSRRVVMVVTGVDYDTAADCLVLAGGSVKKAIVMIEVGVGVAEAERLLARSSGFVRRALRLGYKSRRRGTGMRRSE
jgi:N-acetylmuramic acid 6-phosphate etherase